VAQVTFDLGLSMIEFLSGNLVSLWVNLKNLSYHSVDSLEMTWVDWQIRSSLNMQMTTKLRTDRFKT